MDFMGSKIMSINKTEIGKRVSNFRKMNDMTQENLAELLECSVKHISHVERGTALPSLEKCVILSEFFHCSLDYLLRGREQSNVDGVLPSCILEVLQNGSDEERDLLLAYLNMYSRIRNHRDTDL